MLHASPALAQPLAQILRIAVADAPPATPAPSAVPKPTPTPGPRAVRGGPLLFSLSGSLQMGQVMQSQDRLDPVSGEQSTQSASQSTDSAGLLLHLERRTAATTLQLAVPAGVSIRQGRIGEIQAGYYSPTYALLFGGRPLSALGGVPVGQTLRGPALELPLRGGGDVLLYGGPAFGGSQQIIHVGGVLVRGRVHNALVEFGSDRASDKTGNAATDVVFGVAGENAPGTLSQSFEAAWQQRHGADDFAANGTAYAYRADYGGTSTYSSLSLRHVPQNFLSAGNGALLGDDLVSFGWHGGRFTQYSLNEALERTGTAQAQQMQRFGTLTVSHGFASGSSLFLTLDDQRQVSQLQGAQWLGQASLQAAVPLRNTNAILGVQEMRSTGMGSPFAQTGYSAQLQRMLGASNLSAGYQWLHQTSSQGAVSTGQASLAFTMPVLPRTNVMLSTMLTRTISPASNAVQIMPLLTVQQLISPSLSLAVTYGRQTLHDALNPASNGHVRIFQIQVTAPFAIGSGLVTGREDPKLPATITGSVLQDQSNAGSSLASVMPAGAGNVAVVLDNSQVQRTDLSGRFQFSFVTPGTHTLRLETASLPRGVTADQPYATISVAGGQTGQINFRIGTYGAIAGHLYGLNPDGSKFPVAGATVLVDKNYHAITDDAGAFGVGRLNAGTHEVSIDSATLPANVSYGSDTKRSVNVENGSVSTIDFIASELGSIAGTIEFAPGLGAAYSGGVNNAYVVAEPGDHAAITNPDGTFLIDDLPPGAYSVNVDPETLEEGFTAAGGPFSEDLEPGAHIEGLHFTVRRQMKDIVFSFKGGNTGAAPATLVLRTSALPPGGATTVEFHAGGKAQIAQATAFGRSSDLKYDARADAWVGTVNVPPGTKNGKYPVDAQLQGNIPLSAHAELNVDDTIPIATFVTTPSNPRIGQFVTVRAHFLADVREGDEIRWLDGQITKLVKPLSGRVFMFTVKISERPLSGVLLSGASKLPITLR